MNLRYIIGGITLVVIFITLILVGLLTYKSYFKKNYNFLNCFPFEINDRIYLKNNFLVQLISLIFCMAFAFSYINIFASLNGTLFKIEVGISIVITFLLLSIFMLRILSDKVHFIVAIAFVVISTLNSFYLGYVGFIEKFSFLYGALKYILLGLGLIQLILIVNPKLKNCMKLTKDEEGNLIRPKVFYLAFLEWMIIFINIAQVILLVTGMK